METLLAYQTAGKAEGGFLYEGIKSGDLVLREVRGLPLL